MSPAAQEDRYLDAMDCRCDWSCDHEAEDMCLCGCVCDIDPPEDDRDHERIAEDRLERRMDW